MTLDDLARLRVLPIIVIDDARWAAPLARALIAGGIPGAEVTLRTPAAPAAIAGMAALEGFLVAAGTVLSAADVDRAVGAGASAVVSPGFDARVVERHRASHPPSTGMIAPLT